MDTVFDMLAPHKQDNKKLSPQEIAKQKKIGADELVHYLKKQGGSITFTGSASRFVRDQIKTSYVRYPAGAGGILRHAIEEGMIEIKLDPVGQIHFTMSIVD